MSDPLYSYGGEFHRSLTALGWVKPPRSTRLPILGTACPDCLAIPGERCRTRNGSATLSHHVGRRRIAFRTQRDAQAANSPR